MPIRNFADDIRDRHHGDSHGLNCLREIANHRQGKLSASAELGKLGITLKNDKAAGDMSQPELVAARADMRRAVNALRDHGRAKPENLSDALLEAVESVSAELAMVDHQIKMNNTADLYRRNAGGASSGGSSSNSESTLRDQSGQRIGTMLSNADLRDPSAIAGKLGVRNEHGNEAWGGEPDAPMSLGEFFRGVAMMRTTEGVRNALSEGTNTAGGYTVPTILLPGILNALVPASSLLQAGANVAVLNHQGSSFNIAATDTIPTAAWRNEGGNIAESDPAFRSITITPRSLAFRFKASRELLADSPGLEIALKTAIAQAFAKELDRAGLRGSGTAPEIRGLLNIPGVHAVTNGANGAALANYNKFINASRVIKEADAPAPNTAIMSPREDETMALFADTTGQPLRRPDALSNWNFLTSSQIPTNLTVGTSSNTSEIYVGDFTQFTFFMREGISVQVANELHASTGEVGFICHTRVDVAAMYAKAFAIITGVRPPA